MSATTKLTLTRFGKPLFVDNDRAFIREVNTIFKMTLFWIITSVEVNAGVV